MTLTANFYFCPPVKKWRLLANLCELIPIGCFLHHGMAIHATDPPARVRTRLPVSLDAALVTTETRFVLNRYGFAGVFAKRDQPADSFTAAGCHMIAARPVATFASSFFSFVARVKEKNFPHLGLGKFFELRGVASLANFVANVGSRSRFGGFFFRRQNRSNDAEQKHTCQRHEKKSSHDFSVSYAVRN